MATEIKKPFALPKAQQTEIRKMLNSMADSEKTMDQLKELGIDASVFNDQIQQAKRAAKILLGETE